MNYEEKFEEVFDKMPQSFSSTDFATISRKLGVPDQAITGGYSAKFLNKKCQKVNGKNFWIKKSKSVKPLITTQNNIFKVEMDEQKAIDFLKTRGYRVLRDVTKSVEL